jgi:hypothetical protein
VRKYYSTSLFVKPELLPHIRAAIDPLFLDAGDPIE